MDSPSRAADGIINVGIFATDASCNCSATTSIRVVGIGPARRLFHPQRRPQLQHILAITGLPIIDFLCFFPPNPPLLIEVKRNDDYIRKLLVAEQVFWQQLKD